MTKVFFCPTTNAPVVSKRGFTLAEVMVAMLFVSIALFGYIALHMRILHSASTLQLRHSIRRKVDLHMSQLQARAQAGKLPIMDGTGPLALDENNSEFLTTYIIPVGDQLGNNYSGNQTLEFLPANRNIRHISIQIDWRNQHGPQTYVVDTFHGARDKGW